MMENRTNYRESIKVMGKKEFTLLKMQEYGFWPKNLPTPYERQNNETEEEYNKRKEVLEEYNKIVEQLNELYQQKSEINKKLLQLKNDYQYTWDYERIRKHISKTLMQESIDRRKRIKEQRKQEKQAKTEAWKKYKSENIIYIGKGYSKALFLKDTNEQKLKELGLPIIKDDKELANFLNIPYSNLRFLTYHRDVVKFDNYVRYTIPKKKGGVRNIAAPKTILKNTQRTILDEILSKIEVNKCAHGFIKAKSVVSGAIAHKNNSKIELLINMDLEDFFPTITFERVLGMFKSFGYSGYVSSLLAMICTYCERMKMEIKGEELYVKTTDRILPQGSPASPMVTNIICRNLDNRLQGLATKYNFTYSRYADDISFSFNKDNPILSNENNINIGKILGIISKIIQEEGFNINYKKTKFLRQNNRQAITGIVVNNDEIGVPKKWIKNFRATIYNAKKLKEKGEKIPVKTINEIKGMSSWASYVNKNKYSKIINEAGKILENL